MADTPVLYWDELPALWKELGTHQKEYSDRIKQKYKGSKRGLSESNISRLVTQSRESKRKRLPELLVRWTLNLTAEPEFRQAWAAHREWLLTRPAPPPVAPALAAPQAAPASPPDTMPAPEAKQSEGPPAPVVAAPAGTSPAEGRPAQSVGPGAAVPAVPPPPAPVEQVPPPLPRVEAQPAIPVPPVEASQTAQSAPVAAPSSVPADQVQPPQPPAPVAVPHPPVSGPAESAAAPPVTAPGVQAAPPQPAPMAAVPPAVAPGAQATPPSPVAMIAAPPGAAPGGQTAPPQPAPISGVQPQAAPGVQAQLPPSPVPVASPPPAALQPGVSVPASSPSPTVSPQAASAPAPASSPLATTVAQPPPPAPPPRRRLTRRQVRIAWIATAVAILGLALGAFASFVRSQERGLCASSTAEMSGQYVRSIEALANSHTRDSATTYALAHALELLLSQGEDAHDTCPLVAEESEDSLGSRLTIPDHPLKDQKTEPCDPERYEEGINGGCWIWTGATAPCRSKTWEYAGKCYVPVHKKPKVPSAAVPKGHQPK